MTPTARRQRLASAISTANTLFVLALLFLPTGCSGGSHAEYAPASHPWVGKCAAFSEPMVYLTNLSTEFVEHEEIVRIGRYLVRADDAEQFKTLPTGRDLIVTPVPAGTTFEVTAVFTIIYKGYSRAFSANFDMAVLRDDRGQVSTSNLDSLRPCR